jgi:ABC-type microcin C transport system permease subunit YejB
MREEQDYIRDITEIRSMMERTSKFLSLSGLAGVMAGIYALAGAYIAYNFYSFNPEQIIISNSDSAAYLTEVILLGLLVLIMAISTAIFLSYRKAEKRGEKIWNSASKRLLIDMAVPLLAGGILIIVLLSKGFIGLMVPISLLFYGLAIYNASKFTFNEMKFLGLIQIGLGLLSSYFIEYSLLFWALGFGVVHIVYGIYMHFRHDR